LHCDRFIQSPLFDGGEPIAGQPFAQPDEVKTRSVEPIAVLAHRELAHPLQDEQLDLGQLRQRHEGLDVGFARAHFYSARGAPPPRLPRLAFGSAR